jgi:hypothetical protein
MVGEMLVSLEPHIVDVNREGFDLGHLQSPLNMVAIDVRDDEQLETRIFFQDWCKIFLEIFPGGCPAAVDQNMARSIFVTVAHENAVAFEGG